MGERCEAEGTYESQALARRFYAEAHAAGHPIAAARLGHFHLQYTESDPTPACAERWLNTALAVDAMPPDARSTVENNLAVMLLQRLDQIPVTGEWYPSYGGEMETVQAAAELLESAARRGTTASAYNLGCVYWSEVSSKWLLSDNSDRWDIAIEHWDSAARGGHDVADRNAEWLAIADRFNDLEDGDEARDLALEQIEWALVYVPHERVCPEMKNLWKPAW